MDITLPVAGGLLIGLSALLLMISVGRVAGISGIIANVITIPSSQNTWRYCFLVGLATGSFLVYQFYPTLFNYSVSNNKLELVIAGLLVGFGVRLGGGCTSGHGVCGIPRLSIRSLLAVLIFMFTAMVTVYIKRHVL